MSNKVLFLGITNHCASRFAEILFNHLASEQLLSFYGTSRGVMLKHQEQPIDSRTITALVARGIPLSASFRKPSALKLQDLKDSDHIILISGSELAHRLERTQDISEKSILQWEFKNVGMMAPAELFPALEAEVYLLVRRLQHLQMPYVSA